MHQDDEFVEGSYETGLDSPISDFPNQSYFSSSTAKSHLNPPYTSSSSSSRRGEEYLSASTDSIDSDSSVDITVNSEFPNASSDGASVPLEMSNSSAKKPKKDDAGAEKRFFQCPIEGCGKKYGRRGDLKFHVLHKHPVYDDLPDEISKPKSGKEGKDFPCPLRDCVCGFKHLRDLRRHLRTKHPENATQLEKSINAAKVSEYIPINFDAMNTCTWRILPLETSPNWNSQHRINFPH